MQATRRFSRWVRNAPASINAMEFGVFDEARPLIDCPVRKDLLPRQDESDIARLKSPQPVAKCGSATNLNLCAGCLWRPGRATTVANHLLVPEVIFRVGVSFDPIFNLRVDRLGLQPLGSIPRNSSQHALARSTNRVPGRMGIGIDGTASEAGVARSISLLVHFNVLQYPTGRLGASSSREISPSYRLSAMVQTPGKSEPTHSISSAR